jgi:hypothetical protein
LGAKIKYFIPAKDGMTGNKDLFDRGLCKTLDMVMLPRKLSGSVSQIVVYAY